MIRLRSLEPSDVELLYKWENDTDVWQYGETLVPFSHYHLEEYIFNAKSTDIYSAKQVRLMIEVDFAAENESSSKTIGMVDLFNFDPIHSKACAGILIAAEFRKENFATQALEVFIQYAFGTLKLHQLYCDIPASNTASLKIFQKNGFNIAGIKKDWLKKSQHVWEDAYILQLINHQ